MDIFDVKVKYQIYTGEGSPTTSTITIKRKAKNIGDAITTITALINSLSNVEYTSSGGTVTPYLMILEAGLPSLVN